MAQVISITKTRAQMTGDAIPVVNPDNSLTMRQFYRIGGTNVSGAFVSIAELFVSALGITNVNLTQFRALGAGRFVSITYPVGAQNPVQVRADLAAKIQLQESLTAQGDHVLAADGTVIV